MAAQVLTPVLARPAQNVQRLPVGRETVTKARSGDGAAGDPCQVRPLRSARVENKQVLEKICASYRTRRGFKREPRARCNQELRSLLCARLSRSTMGSR